MAYDGWLMFAEQELVNVARTVQLARMLGIDTVRLRDSSVSWIQEALEGTGGFGGGGFGYGGFGVGGASDYGDITDAPWYDSGFPASSEFAGFVPLSVVGLDDSSLTRETVEYITNGGNSGGSRNATQAIVANLAIIASTDRGAEFGKRWLDRMLQSSRNRLFCSGSDLTYFRSTPPAFNGALAVKAHRRDVNLTRGTSVTKKKTGRCATTWWVTFTLTANDPFEYGEESIRVTGLGGTVAGAAVLASGTSYLAQTSCPSYDYSPIYDPSYPALVPPPPVPDFYPDGWTIESGMHFNRMWAKLSPLEPTALRTVPIFEITTPSDVRLVRVGVWADSDGSAAQCGALFTATATYIPAGGQFIIDGEQEASYVWDGTSAAVRRTDSLVYGMDATPVNWNAFTDPTSLYVTLDIFSETPGYAGALRMAMSLVQKSD